jgi:hypothetical protein
MPPLPVSFAGYQILEIDLASHLEDGDAFITRIGEFFWRA